MRKIHSLQVFSPTHKPGHSHPLQMRGFCTGHHDIHHSGEVHILRKKNNGKRHAIFLILIIRMPEKTSPDYNLIGICFNPIIFQDPQSPVDQVHHPEWLIKHAWDW